MMIDWSHLSGQMPRRKKQLKMSFNSSNAQGPRCLGNVGGMSSGPQAPFALIWWMAVFNSSIVKGCSIHL